jgi:asparagine synthase (glutamine-hydrolysing)
VRKVQRRLARLVGAQTTEQNTLHSDYERWLRTDLRAWGESILFDQRFLERGLFNPEGIRWLWERHMSGKELWTIGKLAPIMSYELMLREFVD